MENKVTARNPITEGCIWKGMLLFALPIMLGSLLQQLYNTADAVIVGRALGKAVLAASDARHESRGSLKRLDFPERDDEHFLAHSVTDVSCQVSWQPVHIVDMPPKAREY